jgi:hypothetical protein
MLIVPPKAACGLDQMPSVNLVGFAHEFWLELPVVIAICEDVFLPGRYNEAIAATSKP